MISELCELCECEKESRKPHFCQCRHRQCANVKVEWVESKSCNGSSLPHLCVRRAQARVVCTCQALRPHRRCGFDMIRPEVSRAKSEGYASSAEGCSIEYLMFSKKERSHDPKPSLPLQSRAAKTATRSQGPCAQESLDTDSDWCSFLIFGLQWQSISTAPAPIWHFNALHNRRQNATEVFH